MVLSSYSPNQTDMILFDDGGMSDGTTDAPAGGDAMGGDQGAASADQEAPAEENSATPEAPAGE